MDKETNDTETKSPKTAVEEETTAGFPGDLEALNERADELEAETGGNLRRFMGCGG